MLSLSNRNTSPVNVFFCFLLAYCLGFSDAVAQADFGDNEQACKDQIQFYRNLFDLEPQGNIHNANVELTILEGQLTHDLHGHFKGTNLEAIWNGAPIDLLD